MPSDQQNQHDIATVCLSIDANAGISSAGRFHSVAQQGRLGVMR